MGLSVLKWGPSQANGEGWSPQLACRAQAKKRVGHLRRASGGFTPKPLDASRGHLAEDLLSPQVGMACTARLRMSVSQGAAHCRAGGWLG